MTARLIAEYGGIALGLSLAFWGLFHQLIVGGAATIFKNVSEHEARLFVMSWVAQGGFMTFAGLLPALLLLFHNSVDPAVRTVIGVTGLALILLAGHVLLTGFRTHVRPVRIGAIFELVFGLYLLTLLVHF